MRNTLDNHVIVKLSPITDYLGQEIERYDRLVKDSVRAHNYSLAYGRECAKMALENALADIRRL